MNADSPKTPREEMEAWLTSLLLSELSEGEAAAVRELMKHDPELAKLHDRLQQSIALLREAEPKTSEQIAPSEPLRLSDERRKQLLTAFKIPPLKLVDRKPKRRLPISFLEILAIAVILGLLASLTMPALNGLATRERKPVTLSALPGVIRSEGVPGPGSNNVYSINVVGYAPVELNDAGIVGDRFQVSGQVADVTKQLGKRLAADNPSDAAFAGNLAEQLRRMARPESKVKTLGGSASAVPGATFGGGALQTPPASPPPPAPVASPAPAPQIVLPSVSAEAAGQPVVATPPVSYDFAVPVQSAVVVSGGATGAIWNFDSSGSISAPSSPVSTINGAGVRAENEQLRERFGVALKSASKQAEGRKSGGVAEGEWFAGDLGMVTTNRIGGQGGTPPLLTTNYLAYADTGGRFAKDNFAFGLFASTDGVASVPGGRGESRTEVAPAVVLDSLETLPLPAVNFATGLPVPSLIDADDISPGGDIYLGEGVVTAKPPATVALGVETDRNRELAETDAKKAPTLGDLPLLGRLFRGTSVSVTNSGTIVTNGQTLELAGFNEPNSFVTPSLAANGTMRGPVEANSSTPYYQVKPPSAAPLPQLYSEELRRQVIELNEAKARLSLLRTNQQQPNLARHEGANPGEIHSLEGKIAGLEKSLGDAQRHDVERATRSRPYYDKKRELEELYGFNRILSTKLAAEKVDLKLPQGSSSTVEIMDRAAPAKEKSGLWRSLGAPVGGTYASTARLKVERDVTDIEGMAGNRVYSQYDPYFIQNEFEMIQSEVVLGKVVEQLHLDEVWAKQVGKSGKLKAADAIGLLKSKLNLAPVRNTSLVDIKVKSDNADEAAKIANVIAEVYLAHRAEERLSHTTSGIKALEERSKEQQEKIKKAQKELEELRLRLAISDEDAQGTAPAPVAKVELDISVPRKPSTNAPIPQPEIQTSENNFSTFSLNVSDVSFKLAAASLEKGQMPEPASVRSEEFLNAFDYRDPEPPAGAAIGFTWERARYPFAHNRDLLRFSLKTAAAGRINGRAMNIVLLLDNSGSMERADRVQIIRQALRVLAEQLQPQDKVSVIMFARTARLVADGISGDKAGEVTEQVSSLTPQGGTNLEEAMNLAYATALKHYLAGGLNRVVLLTDGAANLGDVEPESLKNKVETHRRQGIALDAFGIGWEGYNDDLLEVLSRNGDGRYGFINSPEEAATEFAGQLAGALKVAASDVKVQVEFNPKRVASYRQIGYAKHQLTKEQFRDNTVDAAEIAAQEAGNALYTVEVNPAGEGPLCTVRCRYKVPGTTDYREQAWDVPFTGNALSLEQSSPAMRLAGSAAAFAEWLVASPFAAEVTPDRVLGLMSGVPEVFGADSRPKKLEWMIRQAKSIEGK